MKSKKIIYKKKKNITKKNKNKYRNKIIKIYLKNKFKTKKKFKKYKKTKKTKKFKKYKKNILQHGGDSNVPSGLGGQVSSFVQYVAPQDQAPTTTSGGKARASKTIQDAATMLAIDAPILTGQFILKNAVEDVIPCVSQTPDTMSMAKSMGCTLFEGVAADMVLNGVNGEASGSTPNQNLDLHSITT